MVRAEMSELGAALRAEISDLRTEVHVLGSALLSRIERNDQALHQLSVELAHHARAIQEAVQAQIATLDGQYAELPGRMRRVESVVFPRGGRWRRGRS